MYTCIYLAVLGPSFDVMFTWSTRCSKGSSKSCAASTGKLNTWMSLCIVYACRHGIHPCIKCSSKPCVAVTSELHQPLQRSVRTGPSFDMASTRQARWAQFKLRPAHHTIWMHLLHTSPAEPSACQTRCFGDALQ